MDSCFTTQQYARHLHLYHDGQPVYVGRTRDLCRRLGEHGRVGASHYRASFAFLRVRRVAAAEATGHDLTGISRGDLAKHGILGPLFLREKVAVASMTPR